MVESPLPSVRRAWATPLGLMLMPAIAGATALIAPHLHPSDAVVDFSTFLVPTASAFVGLAIASLDQPSRRVVLAIFGLAGASLLGVAFAHAYSMTLALVVGLSLVALGASIGLPIGRRVQHPGHLLPACVIAAAADVVSVFSPNGPTRAIVESERALSVLALPFPVLGTNEVVPTLGAGDLVFVGILLGVAATHGISRWRIVLLSIVGALLAGFVSALLGAAVPALPAIALTTLAFVKEARVLPLKDRKVAAMAMTAAVTLAGATLISRLVGS